MFIWYECSTQLPPFCPRLYKQHPHKTLRRAIYSSLAPSSLRKYHLIRRIFRRFSIFFFLTSWPINVGHKRLLVRKLWRPLTLHVFSHSSVAQTESKNQLGTDEKFEKTKLLPRRSVPKRVRENSIDSSISPSNVPNGTKSQLPGETGVQPYTQSLSISFSRGSPLHPPTSR